MAHGGGRIFANGQCSVPGSLLQAIELVFFVLFALLAVVASASNKNPASSTGNAVEFDQAGVTAQHFGGPGGYEETHRPVIRKTHMTILTLAAMVVSALCLVAASKKAALSKVRLASKRIQQFRVTTTITRRTGQLHMI